MKFCNTCAPHPENEYLPKCVLCRRSLQSLSIAEKIPPFWRRLGHLLQLPFAVSQLSFIFIFAFVFSLLPTGKIGAILFLLSLIPVIEYLFSNMELVASGDKLNVKLSAFLKFKNKSMFLKLLFAYVFIVLLVAKLSSSLPLIAFALAAFFALGFPAACIILMMEKSIKEMLNPVKIIYIIRCFGSAYFVLYGAIGLATYLSVVSFELALDSGGFLKALILNLLILYLVLSVFLMAGYLVYQYHKELNFTINRRSIREQIPYARTNAMAEVDIMLQEGRFEDARKILLAKISDNPLDYKASEKLILLYAVEEKNSFLKKIADKYFLNLIQHNKSRHAADFFHKLKARHLEYHIESIDVLTAITQEMKNKKQFLTACEAIESYIDEKPYVPGWERLYQVYAELLNEFANKGDKAKVILATIVERGGEQEAIDRAQTYLDTIP
ncbi:hypothetical protein [Aliikangiella sp. G2MR2-5]|uniref:hypothetical protein n=1 Tax=Aliikangiella sp. G2MR2-5 TaxID=2788943 RepID=UPI0018A9352D|nr:hypothetical protein [Aliikangiella sp. G2MR2-5]